MTSQIHANLEQFHTKWTQMRFNTGMGDPSSDCESTQVYTQFRKLWDLFEVYGSINQIFPSSKSHMQSQHKGWVWKSKHGRAKELYRRFTESIYSSSHFVRECCTPTQSTKKRQWNKENPDIQHEQLGILELPPEFSTTCDLVTPAIQHYEYENESSTMAPDQNRPSVIQNNSSTLATRTCFSPTSDPNINNTQYLWTDECQLQDELPGPLGRYFHSFHSRRESDNVF